MLNWFTRKKGQNAHMRDLQELQQERENLLSDSSNFLIREAYKTLRTNVLFSLTGEPGSKVIMVTSSIQSEGKSFTAVNLALSFAQAEKKVLLIDCDLRRPKIFRLLDLRADAGLTNVLVEPSLLRKAIQPTHQENLSVLLSGDVPPNPSELLGSVRMRQLLEELKQEFDYIILDTPPMNMVTDAMVMVPETDGVLFVIRAGKAERGVVMHAVGQLRYAGGRLLGFVMNDVNAEAIRYGSSYRYKNTYGNYGPYRK